MSRQIRILVACLVLLLVSVCLIAFLRGPRDPVRHGKHLSQWVKEYNSWLWEKKAETDIMREFGNSAEPMLRRMLRARDSSLGTKFVQLLAKQHIFKLQIQPAYVSQTQALEICGLLGMQVKGAVPEIEALVKDYPARVKTPGIAVVALNTLAVTGLDGVQALIRVLGHQDSGLRHQAVILLGTAPYSATDEVVAALQKCVNDTDSMVRRAASNSLNLIRQRRSQAVPAEATNFVDTSESPAAAPAYGVWNIGQGTRILGDSGLEQSAGWRDEDLFGGNLSVTPVGETGSVVFQDSKPDGFTHFIEWEIPTPVTVCSFGLIAVHGPPSSEFLRAFRAFRLYARQDESEPFSLVYAENVPVPYGGGPYSCILYLFRNLENPVHARQFRAEFVQNGSGPWNGPRATELYGFSAPLSLPMVLTAIQNEQPFIQTAGRELFHK